MTALGSRRRPAAPGPSCTGVEATPPSPRARCDRGGLATLGRRGRRARRRRRAARSRRWSAATPTRSRRADRPGRRAACGDRPRPRPIAGGPRGDRRTSATPEAELHVSPAVQAAVRAARDGPRRDRRPRCGVGAASRSGRSPRAGSRAARRARPARRRGGRAGPRGQVQGGHRHPRRARPTTITAARALRDRLADHRRRHRPRPVARPERGLRQGPARPVRRARLGRRQGHQRRSATRSTPRRPPGRLPPDSRGLDRDHGRDRAGRDEQRGHRDRGGQGRADRRARARRRPRADGSLGGAPRPARPSDAAGTLRQPIRATRVGAGELDAAARHARRTRSPCSFVSSPTSRGMSPRTSSSSRSPRAAFEGPLDELDRRAGGELRALAAFGELTGKRFATSLAAPATAGRAPAGRRHRRPGDARSRDASSGRRVGRAPARRPRPSRVDGDLADAALAPTGSRRPSSSPSSSRAASSKARTTPSPSIAPRRRESALRRELDELHRSIATRPGLGATTAVAAARRARPDHRRGRQHGARRCRTGPRTTSAPEVLAEEARAIAEQHGLWIDVIDAGARRPSSAWACSWPSGGAATTRRG